MNENVGIVIVSHSADVARGTALMVEQMVGHEVPLGWCGGDPGGGLGTSVEAIMAAIEAVKARGKSDVGQKTMLDVLFPVLAVLREGGTELPVRLKAAAKAAAEQTIPMRAIRGRASFLGERSVGHMDPGARSSALIVDAVADVMEGLA